MAIQQRTRPYETLIRHNPDGSIGSHHVRIQELFDDSNGAVLYAQVQPPQTLTAAGLEAVVGEAFVQATAQIAAQQAQIATLTARVAELEAAGQAAADREAALAARIEQLEEAAQAPAAPADGVQEGEAPAADAQATAEPSAA